MTTLQHLFIEPLDVLYLRGNRLFGGPGSHGESLVPPWPSVAAGALRSWLLASEGIDPTEFARGAHVHPSLGTPEAPGSFVLADLQLARRSHDGRTERLRPLPADLVCMASDGGPSVARLRPVAAAPGIASSGPLPMLPVLGAPSRARALAGRWLTEAGWLRHLSGDPVPSGEVLPSDSLWTLDARVGIGLDTQRRRAADGRLFSAQAVALREGVGFAAAVGGARLPSSGMLRLGGDGRAAAVREIDAPAATPDLARIARERRARLVLTSPGFFARGWELPGAGPQGRWSLAGVSAQIVCASLPRHEVASGWDIARHAPKPAQRAVPAGSVWWLDDLDATPEALGKLAERGLWPDDEENASRRAEGFNRFTFAVY